MSILDTAPVRLVAGALDEPAGSEIAALVGDVLHVAKVLIPATILRVGVVAHVRQIFVGLPPPNGVAWHHLAGVAPAAQLVARVAPEALVQGIIAVDALCQGGKCVGQRIMVKINVRDCGESEGEQNKKKRT